MEKIIYTNHYDLQNTRLAMFNINLTVPLQNSDTLLKTNLALEISKVKKRRR